MHQKGREGIFIGFLITLLLSGLLALKFPPLGALEERLYDYRFKIRGALKTPDNIVIAAIDEKSIEKLGRWPWGREKIAALIEKLTAAGAELIVFDVIFSEKEANDPALARAINDAGNVILPVAFNLDGRGKDSKTAKPENEFLISSAYRTVAEAERLNKHNPVMANGILMPVDELIRSAASVGHINMLADNDGTMRWEFLAIEYNGYLYPPIGLQAAAFYLGIPPEAIVLEAAEGVQLGKKRYLKTEKQGQMLINYYGPSKTFRHIPIADIISNDIKPEQLSGRIVLVGATDAKGVFDLRVTPFTAEMPGVEKHASVIASILEDKLLVNASLYVNIAVLLFSGFVFSIAVSRFKAFWAAGIAVLALTIIVSGGYYAFAYRGVWLNVAYPSVNTLLIFITVTAYNYAVEERYARRIRAMFSNYVTERVVNEMIKNPDLAKLGGERREVTVLFSDIRGFTTFSEKHTPEEVVATLNEYLGAMAEVIFRWEGVLDKFIGDAIVAFWGAPIPQKNHSELALKCAMHMIKRLGELQEKWKAEGKDPIDIGIGINTGEVIVGNIGAEGMKMDYTVIGDAINLGARIESLTRKYDTHILITEFTMNNIREGIETHEIGHVHAKGIESVIVKGKEKSVGIYEIISLGREEDSIITEPEKERVVTLKEK